MSSLHLRARRPLALALALLSLTACVRSAVSAPTPATRPVTPERFSAVPTLVAASPRAVGMDAALPARLDSIVGAALADSMSPGAALAVGRWGRLVHLRGYGTLDWPNRPGAGDDARARVEPNTVYDLASLTKVVATTTAAMILEDEGRLALDSTVAFYLRPALDSTDKARITVRMLLTHSGGLEAYAPLYTQFRGREEYLQQIAARPLAYPSGTQSVYSDWDMVLLQLVIERITGQPLDWFFRDRVAGPLGLRETTFLPNADLRARTAPTAIDTSRHEVSNGGLLRGIVHDGNAWAIGGVSGHAGLFSSARDLAVFAQLLLNDGQYGGVQLIRPRTIARWTAPQDPFSSRALGWDTPSGESSAGRYFSPRSFGHTGFTGTSLWIDPERGVFVVLLTNRVHPLGTSERHAALRRDVADAVSRAILDAPLQSWEPRPR